MRTGGVRLCSHVRGESCHRLRKRVLNRRILSLGAERGQPRSSPAEGDVLFDRKKYQKLPGRCLRLLRAVLTLAPGARLKGGFKGAAQTFIKQASYACTFSRDFVSRLRHRAGIVRRKTRRGGGATAGSETQHPAIASKSGFKPPHYRLERNKNNRQPACPEREAVKA